MTILEMLNQTLSSIDEVSMGEDPRSAHAIIIDMSLKAKTRYPDAEKERWETKRNRSDVLGYDVLKGKGPKPNIWSQLVKRSNAPVYGPWR